jgi:adenylate cyclase
MAPKGALPADVVNLLEQYSQGIRYYNERKFADGLAIFKTILQSYPHDEPSKIYAERCEIYRDYPPSAEWNGVYKMASK